MLTRRRLIAAVGSIAIIPATSGVNAGQPGNLQKRNTVMQIKRSGEQASQKGPEAWFTGQVRIDPMQAAPAPVRVSAGTVTFEPGARTAWHTHPLGQTLIIVSGLGWVQSEGGAIEEVRPGDVVWFPPGLKHWHGASPSNAMAHIAITEALDGKAVDWLEKVTDQQYAK
jgi:quercetin dioxygenase-like cupin family protein